MLRSDNLSAATHELKVSSGRALTPRFRAVLEHYGIRSSRITPGRAHDTTDPTLNQWDCTATPTAPVAGSRATME